MIDKAKLADTLISGIKDMKADEGECVITDTEKTEMYYESGKIGLLRTSINMSATLKVIKDKKKGLFSTNDLSDPNRIILEAAENCKASIPDDAEGICDKVYDEVFSEGNFKPDKQALYDGLNDFIKLAKEKHPKISFDSITFEHVTANKFYKNTRGSQLSETRGYYVFSPMFMARDGEKSSSFNASEGVFLNPKTPLIDIGMTKRLLEETEKQIYTQLLQGKFVGSIIVTPPCVEEILETIEDNFLSDSVLINNTSLFKNSLETKIATQNLTLHSAPRCKNLVSGYCITGDGYIAENMPLIENGILKNFVISRYGAKKTGRARSVSNGGCYIMKTGDTPLEDMIKSTKHGLLLNRFSGGSPGVDGDITGVAKNSFLIEDGKITKPLSETMISGNLAKMLNDISQISSESLNNGDSILPWIKIDNITISGK